MSTDTRRSRRTARRRRGFSVALAAVISVLAVIGGVGAGVSLTQGPRVTQVQVDPASAIAESGSRVILTANEALADVADAQVTVEPETEHTIDASGRTVGVRFPAALDAGTTYTVTVSGATGLGGGPSSTLTTSFTTPAAGYLVLERSADGDDRIASRTVGSDAEDVVYEAPTIDDFRATSGFLAVSTGDGLTVVDRATGEARDVALPGEGTIAGLQVSEKGQLYGFVYTDDELTETSGRNSVLYTGELRAAWGGSADPAPVEVAGSAPSINAWRFVPETSSLLLNDFDGDLTLVDQAGGDPSSFGLGSAIAGIARSTYTAIVETADQGIVGLDLETGDTTPLADVDHDGVWLLNELIPTADGGTLRAYGVMDGNVPRETRIVEALPGGSQLDVATVAESDALLQVCASPSAQYAAVVVAPDIVGNRYDGGHQAMPETVETRIVDIATGDEIQVVPGFDSSWCEVGPW
ncbi:Ig-like domain-containing protein [Microbacterium indicum]|uniref:Ig-like domain-containing protein n=1 Tax=Microbacterium indicum TaxID=358100 RepID=UPI000428B9DC|nr:Ig-like domain-containing protein [Microbacterium indicum]